MNADGCGIWGSRMASHCSVLWNKALCMSFQCLFTQVLIGYQQSAAACKPINARRSLCLYDQWYFSSIENHGSFDEPDMTAWVPNSLQYQLSRPGVFQIRLWTFNMRLFWSRFWSGSVVNWKQVMTDRLTIDEPSSVFLIRFNNTSTLENWIEDW